MYIPITLARINTLYEKSPTACWLQSFMLFYSLQQFNSKIQSHKRLKNGWQCQYEILKNVICRWTLISYITLDYQHLAKDRSFSTRLIVRLAGVNWLYFHVHSHLLSILKQKRRPHIDFLRSNRWKSLTILQNINIHKKEMLAVKNLLQKMC